MSDRGPTPLLIFPCNGNGLEALDCLGVAWNLVGFVDDTEAKQVSGACGQRVMSRTGLDENPDALVLAVPGGPTSYRARRRIIEGLKLPDKRFARVIHPTARVSPLATIGLNVLIMAGVVITSNAVIGDHVCLLPNTVIHHDALIGAWSLVGSNVSVSGSVRIGENCYIGSGSSIMNGLHVGDGAQVGIGSNVVRDVAPATCVGGNPAHFLFAAPV